MAETNLPAEQMIAAGHELRDLSPKNIAIFAGSLAVTIVIVILVCYGLVRYFHGVQTKPQVAPGAFSYSPELAPGPRLETTPGRDLTSMRAEEHAILSNYGWIDRQKGTVRIPIKRAMEILAQRGLPARARNSDQANREPATKKNEQPNRSETTR